MLASIRKQDDFYYLTLQNGKKIVGLVDIHDDVVVIENDSELEGDQARYALGLAIVYVQDGVDTMVWRRLKDEARSYELEEKKRTLYIN